MKEREHYLKAYVVESKSGDKKPMKMKWFRLKSKEGRKPFKKDKFKFTYFNYKKPGHIAHNCCSTELVSTFKDKGKQSVELDKTIATIYESNLVGDEVEWWVDTDVTCHICNDRALVNSYETINEMKIFIGKLLHL